MCLIQWRRHEYSKVLPSQHDLARTVTRRNRAFSRRICWPRKAFFQQRNRPIHTITWSQSFPSRCITSILPSKHQKAGLSLQTRQSFAVIPLQNAKMKPKCCQRPSQAEFPRYNALIWFLRWLLLITEHWIVPQTTRKVSAASWSSWRCCHAVNDRYEK